MRRAVDSRSVQISLSPLVRSVLPVLVRSTTTSAMPRWGATSAAPETGTTSTARPFSAKNALASRGKTVAARVLRRQLLDALDAPSPRARRAPGGSDRTRGRAGRRPARPVSQTRSQPVTPASATPSETSSGMSWLRTKIASNSPPSEAVRARSPRARISRPGVGEDARGRPRPACPCSVVRCAAWSGFFVKAKKGPRGTPHGCGALEGPVGKFRCQRGRVSERSHRHARAPTRRARADGAHGDGAGRPRPER